MSENMSGQYEPRHLAGTVAAWWKQDNAYVPRHAGESRRVEALRASGPVFVGDPAK